MSGNGNVAVRPAPSPQRMLYRCSLMPRESISCEENSSSEKSIQKLSFHSPIPSPYSYVYTDTLHHMSSFKCVPLLTLWPVVQAYISCPARALKNRVTQPNPATWWCYCYPLPDQELATCPLPSSFKTHNAGLVQYECGHTGQMFAFYSNVGALRKCIGAQLKITENGQSISLQSSITSKNGKSKKCLGFLSYSRLFTFGPGSLVVLEICRKPWKKSLVILTGYHLGGGGAGLRWRGGGGGSFLGF
jgi:hypothetical protein